ncbi:hypothetical protein Hanom_Chr01g00010441 [Helianthus anomalus]
MYIINLNLHYVQKNTQHYSHGRVIFLVARTLKGHHLNAQPRRFQLIVMDRRSTGKFNRNKFFD